MCVSGGSGPDICGPQFNSLEAIGRNESLALGSDRLGSTRIDSVQIGSNGNGLGLNWINRPPNRIQFDPFQWLKGATLEPLTFNVRWSPIITSTE